MNIHLTKEGAEKAAQGLPIMRILTASDELFLILPSLTAEISLLTMDAPEKYSVAGAAMASDLIKVSPSRSLGGRDCLFDGGPEDGRSYSVADHINTMFFDEFDASMIGEVPDPEAKPKFIRHRYTRKSANFVAFVYRGVEGERS